jgi:hypothetical protein
VVAEAIFDAVPHHLRCYFTPLVALAFAHFEQTSQPGVGALQVEVDVAASFKSAGKILRGRCMCCILRNKPRCCAGRSLLERSTKHGCLFCSGWILRGFGGGFETAASLLAPLEMAARTAERAPLPADLLRIGAVAGEEEARAPAAVFQGLANCAPWLRPGANAATPGRQPPPTPPAAARAARRSPADIPRVIHQIWIGPHPLPARWVQSWQRYCAARHPAEHWAHRVWRDGDVERFLEGCGGTFASCLLPLYRRLPQHCLRADVARYAILWVLGGVYVDADMVWLEGRGSVLSPLEEQGGGGGGGGGDTRDGRAASASAGAHSDLLLVWESEAFGADERVGNSIIGAPPRHPVLQAVIGSILAGAAALDSLMPPRRFRFPPAAKDSLAKAADGPGCDGRAVESAPQPEPRAGLHPFLSQFKVCYRLVGPPQLTRCFHLLGLPRASVAPAARFFPVPWWCGQSLGVSAAEVARRHPAAITTHFGYSTNGLAQNDERCSERPGQQEEEQQQQQQQRHR